ncbi:MAG: hypothetical protein H6765_07560 [Candidatus Peribacteria bacterium]|nr:MAG: hypothetical protein H6765_07560 [Candidatus Peribacteria bacterium]
MFATAHIESYFAFEGFSDAETFAGKISSKDQDIVVRTINMGLKKDMSNLVNSSVANINPSNYINQQLADDINAFFLAEEAQKPALKAKIDAIYREDMPFVILGKELSAMNIRADLEFPYPFRLYVLGRRKDFINGIQLFKHLTINWSKVFDLANAERFFANKLA